MERARLTRLAQAVNEMVAGQLKIEAASRPNLDVHVATNVRPVEDGFELDYAVEIDGTFECVRVTVRKISEI